MHQPTSANKAGRPRRNGKAKFMRLLPSIREAVASKESLRVIHDAHGEALRIGYVQFTRYVKTFVTGEGSGSGCLSSGVNRAAVGVPPSAACPLSPIPLASSEQHQARQVPSRAPAGAASSPVGTGEKDFIQGRAIDAS